MLSSSCVTYAGRRPTVGRGKNQAFIPYAHFGRVAMMPVATFLSGFGPYRVSYGKTNSLLRQLGAPLLRELKEIQGVANRVGGSGLQEAGGFCWIRASLLAKYSLTLQISATLSEMSES